MIIMYPPCFDKKIKVKNNDYSSNKQFLVIVRSWLESDLRLSLQLNAFQIKS